MLPANVGAVAREVLANVAMQVPAIRSWRLRRGRTANLALPEQASLIHEEFEFFRSNVGQERLRGATVVEIGPGDSIPLALLFLAAGASRYVAVDRFLGDIDSAPARALYRAVDRDWQPSQDSRVVVLRAPIEDTPPTFLHGASDVIISFNVVEHLSDVRASFRSMAAMLKPGGRMLHRIDYGPHQFWPRVKEPMGFLITGDRLWRLMGSARGFPNRERHAQVIEAVRAAGLAVTDRPTHCFSSDEVRRAAPSLTESCRGLTLDELAVWDGEVYAAKQDMPPTFGGSPFRGGRL